MQLSDDEYIKHIDVLDFIRKTIVKGIIGFSEITPNELLDCYNYNKLVYDDTNESAPVLYTNDFGIEVGNKYTYPLVKEWFSNYFFSEVSSYYGDKVFSYSVEKIINSKSSKKEFRVIAEPLCNQRKDSFDDVRKIIFKDNGSVEYRTARQDMFVYYNLLYLSVNKDPCMLEKNIRISNSKYDYIYGYKGYDLHINDKCLPVMTSIPLWRKEISERVKSGTLSSLFCKVADEPKSLLLVNQNNVVSFEEALALFSKGNALTDCLVKSPYYLDKKKEKDRLFKTVTHENIFCIFPIEREGEVQ